MTPQFSPEEIERMRQMVAAADANSNRQGIREFDLNNPPKLPYRHQEYPLMVYHHGKKVHDVAHDSKEEARLAKKGYQRKPWVAPAEPVDPEDVDMTEDGEAAGE